MKIFRCEFDVTGYHESDGTAGRVMQIALNWIQAKGYRYCHIYGMCREAWQVYVEAPNREILEEQSESIGVLHQLENFAPPRQQHRIQLWISEEASPDELHWVAKKPISELLHH